MDKVGEKRVLRCLKKGILIESVLIIAFAAIVLGKRGELLAENSSSANVLSIENDYIKWVDFTVSYEALCKAYDWDVKTHGSEHEIDWVELLAYTASKTGGAFGKDAQKTMEKAAEKLSAGETTMEELTKELKYYVYYKEAYDAAIGGLVGEYWEEDPEAAGNAQALANSSEDAGKSAQTDFVEGTGKGSAEEKQGEGQGHHGNPGNSETSENSGEDTEERAGYIKKYGLKGYFPLARGFDYSHYDDFGAGRSYGYKRKHLGSYVIIVSSW